MSNLKVLGGGLDAHDPSYKKLCEDRLNKASYRLFLGHENCSQSELWALLKDYQKAKVLFDKAKEVNFAPYLVNDPDIYDDEDAASEAININYEAVAISLGM